MGKVGYHFTGNLIAIKCSGKDILRGHSHLHRNTGCSIEFRRLLEQRSSANHSLQATNIPTSTTWTIHLDGNVASHSPEKPACSSHHTTLQGNATANTRPQSQAEQIVYLSPCPIKHLSHRIHARIIFDKNR